MAPPFSKRRRLGLLINADIPALWPVAVPAQFFLDAAAVLIRRGPELCRSARSRTDAMFIVRSQNDIYGIQPMSVDFGR